MEEIENTYLVYFYVGEYLQSRGDLEGYNSNPFSNKIRRITMGNCNIYNFHTNKVIGEYTMQQTQIESNVKGVRNFLTQGQVNIFDELIIPNITSGFLEADNGEHNPNPYENIDYFFPLKAISYDWLGRKVVINILPKDPNVFGKQIYKIDVYKNRC